MNSTDIADINKEINAILDKIDKIRLSDGFSYHTDIPKMVLLHTKYLRLLSAETTLYELKWTLCK